MVSPPLPPPTSTRKNLKELVPELEHIKEINERWNFKKNFLFTIRKMSTYLLFY